MADAYLRSRRMSRGRGRSGWSVEGLGLEVKVDVPVRCQGPPFAPLSSRRRELFGCWSLVTLLLGRAGLETGRVEFERVFLTVECVVGRGFFGLFFCHLKAA